MSQLWWLRVLGPVVGRFPSVFYPMAGFVGFAAWHTRPRQRSRLISNLAPFCDGEQQAAARAGRRAYQNVARYWVDVVTMPHRDMLTFEQEHLRLVDGGGLRAINEPGAVILASAHTGNAELAIQALTHRGKPFIAIVQELQPPELARRMLAYRSAGGGNFQYADFAGLRACIEALRAGNVVGMMADRDIQGSGVPVSLAGRCVRLPRGPWELARRTGAAVVPAFAARRTRDHLDVYLEEPFCVSSVGDPDEAINAAAQRFAKVLEAHLRRDPGQWTVLEDYWKVHGCGES